MNQHRIVLTGASGMLGGAILKQLASRHDVIALALYRSVWPRGTAINVEPRLLDLARHDDVDRMLQEFRPTAFIHTAAVGMQHPLPDMATLAKVNVELPLTLMAAVSQILNCHFVQISSGLAYKDQGRLLREDDPLKTSHPYGASKAEAEQHLQALAQDRGVRLTILRPFSFTGERDFGTRLFPSLLRSAVEQRPFEMSPGDQVREHSSVNDIGRGVIAAALQPFDTTVSVRVFNLGSGDTRPLREVVSSVVDQLGLSVDLRFGARPRSPHEPMFTVADLTRARKEFGWSSQESLAHAVWKLARSSFPSLDLNEPPPP
jgi:nucleoside-diphosphate-sugar epimerase